MNIFSKVALQGLVKNRTRTLVTVIGVALSAALITGVSTFAVSLQDYMVNGAIVKYGGWQVEFPDVDSSFAEEQSGDSRIEGVASYENIGYAMLEGGENPDKPYVFIAGFHRETFDALPVVLLSGRWPENSGEVLVPSHVASNGGVKLAVGDTLTLAAGARQAGEDTLNQHDPYRSGEERVIPGEEKTYTVVGICQRPTFEERSAPGYTLITAADETAFGGRISAFVTLKNPYQVHSYAESASAGGSYVLNNEVLRFLGLSGEKMLTGLLYSVSGVLIALVMLGSVFLIYNSFNISLNERMHQFGILMSVGATEKQLRNSVAFEGLCIGAVGIPLGVLLGIPSMKLVLDLVAKNFANVLYDNVPLTLKVSGPAVAVAAAVSMAAILISAWLPARKAAAIPVMECIRQTNEIKVEAGAAPSRFAAGFRDLEKMLALKNFRRNRQRYRSIILSLTLSVVLFVSSNSFGTYLKQIAGNSSEVAEDYDICFYTQDMEEGEVLELYDRLKTADGVTESTYQALSTYSCVLEAADLTSRFLEEYGPLLGYDGTGGRVKAALEVQFVEESVYQNLLKGLGLSPEEYTGEDEKMIMAGLLPDKYFMQEEPMEFTLHSGSGDRTKRIRAVFVNDYPDLLPREPGDWPGYGLMVIAPYRAKAGFDALEGTVKPTQLGMTFRSENPGRSTARMRDMIEGMGITADYSLYNVYGLLDQNRNILFIVNLFSAVFITMITLIGVANVFNTISTNIRLRRRELAMLRSVGMSDRDFNRMMGFECILYGFRTMLWSMPLSGLLSWLIYKGMDLGGGDELHFLFPWGSMAVSMAGVVLIVFITTLYAVGKIKKENIIDALRENLT